MERRELVGSLEPGAPSPGGSGTSEALGPPTSILTDFRFRGSVALPGITVLQSVLPFTAMRPVRPDCAEIIPTESGPLFYINGPYSFEISDDGAEFMLCRDMSMPPRDVHHVITVRGGTLVEVVAFPEVRVSKEEIIEMVKSLQPAETEHAKP
jgi:hypothetical protein